MGTNRDHRRLDHRRPGGRQLVPQVTEARTLLQRADEVFSTWNRTARSAACGEGRSPVRKLR